MDTLYPTYRNDTCRRNLYQNLATQLCQCKCLLAENFKHSRRIKPHNFGHVHQCNFLVPVSRVCVISITDKNTSELRIRNAGINIQMYTWNFSIITEADLTHTTDENDLCQQ